MKVVIQQSIMEPTTTEVRCNLCGKKVKKDNIGYFEDHISLSKTWGYHSPYDGEEHAIDLCLECYKDWINEFEIPPSKSSFIA